jgi:hypothetical protein
MEINLENLKKSYNLLSKEFNNNFKDKYNTWEFHQLILTIGLLKDLIKTIQDPNGLIKANQTYKKIKGENGTKS